LPRINVRKLPHRNRLELLVIESQCFKCYRVWEQICLAGIYRSFFWGGSELITCPKCNPDSEYSYFSIRDETLLRTIDTYLWTHTWYGSKMERLPRSVARMLRCMPEKLGFLPGSFSLGRSNGTV
jgi:hypothetical protein